MLAHGMAQLSKREADVMQVIHLSDRFARTEKDPVWIPALAEDGEPWYVISIDNFQKDHRAERAAISRGPYRLRSRFPVVVPKLLGEGSAARAVVATHSAARADLSWRRLQCALAANSSIAISLDLVLSA